MNYENSVKITTISSFCGMSQVLNSIKIRWIKYWRAMLLFTITLQFNVYGAHTCEEQ